MLRRAALGIQPGLARIEQVLEELGTPQHNIGRTLVVAGTNGKGSVAAFAHSILVAAGKKAALYTSPHLIDVCERVRLGDGPIAGTDFDEAGAQVLASEKACGVSLTGFEYVTAAAFLALAGHNLDYTILEVGLGGRLDATNVTRPAATVVTPLGLEHTDFLGDNLVSIAGEKLGVARKDVPCVLAKQTLEAAAFLTKACAERGIPAIFEGEDYSTKGSPAAFNFTSPGFEVRNARLALNGHYQVQNAGLAVAACRALLEPADNLEEACRRGLAEAAWPGRFDLRHTGHGTVLCDGAHNAVAARALVRSFAQSFEHRPTILVALKKDKDAAGVLAELAELASAFIFTDLPGGGGHAPADLARRVEGALPVVAEPDPDAALTLLTDLTGGPAPPGAPNVCCGSLFLVGYYLRRLAPLQDATEQQP